MVSAGKVALIFATKADGVKELGKGVEALYYNVGRPLSQSWYFDAKISLQRKGSNISNLKNIIYSKIPLVILSLIFMISEKTHLLYILIIILA